MRIFKTKALAKFTRHNGISDASLVTAVEKTPILVATSSSNESQDRGKANEVAFEC